MRTIYLHPGSVLNEHGDPTHYVGARELAELYGVNIMECLVVRHMSDNDHGCESCGEDLHLYPSNGPYEKVKHG